MSIRIQIALPTISLLLLAGFLAAADGVMTRLDFKPFYIETDLGMGTAEQKATATKFAKRVAETGNFFLKVYNLPNTCFEDYAKFYDPKGDEFDRNIRIRIFAKYESFLADFQKRYETKTIPGAFFGVNRPKDEYKKFTGPWLRELSTHAEGITDEQILRHLYHEMGHLFMQTFITYQVEVPSWMEEGTAELFQYRKGNGTNPERERDERAAWLVEMITEKSTIPWAEFIKVQNLDNLDFTWKDPLRSTIQYAQAWSVTEFMISNPDRQRAYTTLLEKFKDSAKKAMIDASTRGLSGDALNKQVRPHLYAVQEALFKDCYGADLLAVEGKWKEWVVKSYEKDVIKNPVLRYNRGVWHVAYRARFAKTKDEKAECLTKAETIFNECVQLTPKLPEGHVGLGRVALERGDFKTGGEEFAKALELGSDNFDALLYGGIAKIQNGEAADAVAALTLAVKQLPSHFDANFYLGQALAVSNGGEDEALLHLRRARDLRPAQAHFCAQLEGMVLYHANKLHEAYISFLRAYNLDQGNQVTPLLMAVVKSENNERGDALDILVQAEKTGNPFAKDLAALVSGDKPMPKLIFSRRGWPLVENLTIPKDEAPPAKADAGKKPDDKPAKNLFDDKK